MTRSSETNRNGEFEKDRAGRNPGPLWARARAERVNDRAAQAIVAGVECRTGYGAPFDVFHLQVRNTLSLIGVSNLGHVNMTVIWLLLSIVFSLG